jgi:hypothetical protein
MTLKIIIALERAVALMKIVAAVGRAVAVLDLAGQGQLGEYQRQ